MRLKRLRVFRECSKCRFNPSAPDLNRRAWSTESTERSPPDGRPWTQAEGSWPTILTTSSVCRPSSIQACRHWQCLHGETTPDPSPFHLDEHSADICFHWKYDWQQSQSLFHSSDEWLSSQRPGCQCHMWESPASQDRTPSLKTPRMRSCLRHLHRLVCPATCP